MRRAQIVVRLRYCLDTKLKLVLFKVNESCTKPTLICAHIAYIYHTSLSIHVHVSRLTNPFIKREFFFQDMI